MRLHECRRVVFTLLICAVLVLSAVAGSGGQERPLVAADLHQISLQRGAVRVLVQIDAPYVPEVQLATPAHVVAQRQHIASTQDAVRRSLRGIAHRVVRDFRGAVPVMAIEVGPDGLRMLESLRGIVTDVVEDKPRHPALAESTPRIQADQAAALGYDGTGAAIVILDTGVDRTHPFFEDGSGTSRIVHEACFSSNSLGATTLCPNGLEQDLGPGAGDLCPAAIDGCDHGTLVAGIAAGRGTSFNGVAPGAGIVAIQVFSRFDDAVFCGAPAFTPCVGSFPSDEIEAGVYIRDTLLAAPLSMNIAAVNLSFGSGAFSVPCDANFPGETTLITDLRARGVATVVASGNGGVNGSLTAPACIGSAISVGATTDPPSEAIAGFSNRAAGMSLLAPGASINTSAPGGGFQSADGTSMAAPHVAGIFAIFKQAVPSATVSEVLAALQATGQSIGGFKRVKVLDALATFSNVVPTVQFGSGSYSVNEGDTTSTTTITVTRTGPASLIATGTTTVLVSTSPGTATAGTTGSADYVALTNQLVTFGPGETSRNVQITIRGDFTVEPNETVVLTLSNAVGAAIGLPTAMLTLVNDDTPGAIRFDQPAYSVNEGAGTATITLRRTGGVAAGAAALVSTVTGGTATAGADYTAVNNLAVTFAAGSTTATFTIAIADDSLAEANETVNLQIASVGGGATLGSPSTAVLTIVSNDTAGSVQFSQAAYAVTEGTAIATITVNRGGGTASGVTVQYRVVPGSPGTATGGGADYTLATGTLTFAAGDTVKTFTVAIVNDTLVEPDETVNLELFNRSVGLTLGTPGTATLTIRDNDAPTFNFGAAVYSVAEGAAASVTVVRANGVGSVATVDYQIRAASTATGGQDYTLANGTVTFGVGITTRTITIPTIADALFEGDETIVLKLVTLATGTVIAPDTTTVTIIDNASTAGAIQFSAATYSVNEGAGPATITLQRTGSVAAGAVAMVSTVAGGTATAGADYTSFTNRAVTFAVGSPTATFTVTIVDDTVVESDETVNVQIMSVTGGGTIGAQSTAGLTIASNDVAGTVQFSQATYQGTEGATTATITLNRTGGAASGVMVQYRVVSGNPGTATGGGLDYTLATGTLTFGAGDPSKTFTVSIANDTLIEPDETVNLELFNPTSGLMIGAQGTTTLTIHDNDAPTFRFGAATYTAVEGTVASVTVVRANGAGTAVTVGYQQQAAGTATGGGVDYALANGTLTFAAGITTQSITIPTTPDTLFEGTETIVLQLVSPSLGAVIAPDTTTVTIVDNDTPGTIQFSLAAYSVLENAGSTSVRVTRTGTNLASGITVQFTTTNGTATAGVDYTGSSQELTFAGGEAFKDVAIPILDDGLSEGNETVVLTLGSPSGGAALGAGRTAVLTILDDEQTLQFSAPVYVVTEATTPATVTVLRTGPPLGTVTVEYATAAGSAGAGADYSSVGGTLTFPPGIASRTFGVPILSDTVFEATESVALLLTNATGSAQLGPLSTSTIVILDNDPPGAIRFSAPTYTVSESGGVATITVQRTPGTASAVTVDYATVAGGTATAGVDYLTTSGTLTFNAGEASKTVTIPILNDTGDEPDETVNLALSNPTGGATLGTPGTAVLTISDNDVPGPITLSAATYTVAETAGLALIRVNRTGGASGVTVSFTTADGSATAPADYTAVSQTLSFGPGETSKIVAIPIVDDGLREGNETVRLILSSPTGGAALGVNSQAMLTITDNEIGATVQFGAATYTVAENVVGGVANVTITRTGSTVPGQTVLFGASPGTASGGTDFTAISNRLVTFTGTQASVIVPVTILSNVTIAGSRTVNLTLSNPGGGLSLGVPRTAVLTILEDDATVQIAGASYSVAEGAVATLTVTRTGGTLVTATVSYATSPGTATAGADYTTATGTLVFGPGVTSQIITVATINDALVEGPETFTVTLSSPSPATSISLGSPSTVTLTINDNDAFGSLQLASATYSVTEGAVASLVVTRTGGSAGAVTVQYATSNGGGGGAAATGGAPTAVGTDYTTLAGTLTFLNGVTSRTITVPTKTDTLREGPETFRVTLSSPGGGATLGAAAAAVVTIVDDETPRLQLAAASSTVAEAAGSVTLTVQRVGPTTTQNTVQYALAGLTATGGGVDFVSTGGVLTFAAGLASRTIVVPVVNDTINEGPETFTVTLSNPTGGAILGTPSVATVTLTDNDPAGVVQFSQLSYTVVEGRPATITVTRTGTAGPVAVSFATTNGSATTPADYAGTAGTLTFQAGETTKTFTVTTAADALTEGSESVGLTLSAPTNGLALGSMSTATLWVVDEEQSVQFGSAGYSVIEGGTVLVTVTRSGVPAGTVTVNYQLGGGGTATETADFTLTPGTGTLTFAPGVATLTITVKTVNDLAIEGPEAIVLQLSGPTGAVLGTRSTTQVALIDNERPDLVVGSLAGPAQAATGSTMMVVATVINQAGGAAPATTLGIFISSSSTTPGAGTRIGLVATPAIAGGASYTATAAVSVPAGLAPGNYFLSALTDIGGVVIEESDTNNGLTAPAQVDVVVFQ